MDIVLKSVGEIIPYENNPRDNSEAIDKVAESIKRYGFKQAIVIDHAGVIVVGHTRFEAAKALGMTEVPCVISELSDEENKEYRLVDNKTNEYAKWDFSKLSIELEDMDLDGFDFEWGISADLDTEDVQEQEIPELSEDVSIIQLGDIIELGQHRLMCGDSTNADDVAKLMNGEVADLLITDPPYNVDYEGGTGLKIKNDNMADDKFQEFLFEAFQNANNSIRDGAVFYIWHADSNGYGFRKACADVGWQVRQCLIWAKNALVMGRQDYQWRHEPCLYGWKDGASHYFGGDRKQTTVLEFDKPKVNEFHPTMKPVELFSYQMQNSSKKGDKVLDVFGGSGTTIIAAEHLERKAYMMEFDPKYCDVIVKRYANFTACTDDICIIRGGERLKFPF